MLTETVVAVSIEVLVIVIVVLTLLKKPSFPLSFSITLDSVSTEEARSEAARSPIASSCGDLGERDRRRRFPAQGVTVAAPTEEPALPCRHVDQRVTTCVDMKTKVRVPRLKSNLASSPPLTEN